MRIFLPFLFLILSCEPNRLEVVEYFDNGAPREAYEVSSSGERLTFFSWHRNGIKSAEIPLQNELPNGKYRRWNTYGTVVEECYYRDSLPHGKCVWFLENGKPFMQGRFVLGAKDGKWTLLHTNGSVRGYMLYKNDSAVGLWRKFHSDGKTAEENSCHKGNEKGFLRRTSAGGNPEYFQECKHNIPHGKYIDYYPGGKPHKIGLIENGKLNGLTVEYKANGEIWKMENWKAGLRDGDWIRYDSAGGIKSRVVFANGSGFFEDTLWQDGKISGELRIELENGKFLRIEDYFEGEKAFSRDYLKENMLLLSKGSWQKGQKHGIWRNWWRNGNIKDSLTFENGEILGEQFHFDSTGRLYKKELARGKNFPTLIEMISP